MNIKFLKSGLIVVLGLVVIASTVDAVTRLKDPGNKHNLSNWGTGDIKAVGTTLKDTEVCIYCHAPHNADSTVVPLWGHKDTAFDGYSMAKSDYVKPGNPGVDSQPLGISKKCLSCHDGTIAIGALISGDIDMTSGANQLETDDRLKSSAPGYIGTDLRSGHVISFKYDALLTNNTTFAKLKSWASIDPLDQKSMFDGEKKMHCHSCHDPHADWCTDASETVGKDPLWRKACDGNGRNSSVCEVCHKTTFSGYTQGPPW